jgi:hypothetical protein
VHAVDTIGTTGGMQWAETTIDAEFGEHPQEAYQRLGLDTRPDIAPGIGTWGFVTPSDVAQRKTELDAMVKSTSRDVARCATLDAPTREAWTTFASGWASFMADTPGWLDSGAQGRQASEYADELHQWQERLSALCPLSAPVVAPESDQGSSLLKTIAIVVGVVAGAVAVVKVADIAKPRRVSA